MVKMAERLSVLIFSRNDIDNALDLINDVYDFADDIVLVDSSSAKLHEELIRKKAKRSLSKLRVFYVVPLGYPDPLRMYAIYLI